MSSVEHQPEQQHEHEHEPRTGQRAEPQHDQQAGQQPEQHAEQRSGQQGEPSGSTTLISPELTKDYQNRWNELKGRFVDDPQHAVHGIDTLVGEVLDELQRVFRTQRDDLGHGLHDKASTEDLRVAFGKYREFFERLLSF